MIRRHRDPEPRSDGHGSPFAGLLSVLATPPAWFSEALCAQTDPEVFFPEVGGSARLAKQVCNGNADLGIEPCPVRAECLAWSLEHNERFGIWGGVTERKRTKMRLRQTGDAA